MRSFVSMLAMAITLLACSLAAAAPVAMVTDISGSVRFSEAGKERAAVLLSYVEPATSFKVAPGARLVLAYLSRPVEATLTGPAEGIVGADGVRTSSGAVSSRALQASSAESARKFESVHRERIALATVQMRSLSLPKLTIQGPGQTSVYANPPLLSWSALPGVSSYRVTLRERGGKVFLDRSVPSAEYRLEQPLAFGSAYEWRVEAQRSGQTLSAESTFSMIDAGTAQRLDAIKPAEGAPFSERVLFAARLQSEGLAYDAKREWRSLAAERDDPALRDWTER